MLQVGKSQDRYLGIVGMRRIVTLSGVRLLLWMRVCVCVLGRRVNFFIKRG